MVNMDFPQRLDIRQFLSILEEDVAVFEDSYVALSGDYEAIVGWEAFDFLCQAYSSHPGFVPPHILFASGSESRKESLSKFIYFDKKPYIVIDLDTPGRQLNLLREFILSCKNVILPLLDIEENDWNGFITINELTDTLIEWFIRFIVAHEFYHYLVHLGIDFTQDLNYRLEDVTIEILRNSLMKEYGLGECDSLSDIISNANVSEELKCDAGACHALNRFYRALDRRPSPYTPTFCSLLFNAALMIELRKNRRNLSKAVFDKIKQEMVLRQQIISAVNNVLFIQGIKEALMALLDDEDETPYFSDYDYYEYSTMMFLDDLNWFSGLHGSSFARFYDFEYASGYRLVGMVGYSMNLVPVIPKGF